MIEGTRDFAARLAGLDDATLARLFAARGVSPRADWSDFFDAAEALASEPSVARALSGLPAGILTAIAAAVDGPVDESTAAVLAPLMLIGPSGHPRPEVARGVAALGMPARVDVEAAPASAPQTAAAAAERAFTAVDSLGDLLLDALHSPLARIGSGALGAAERRRLAEDAQHPEDLDALVQLAIGAGLLVGEDRRLVPTAAAEEWLRVSTAQRWLRVARALVRRLPGALRTADGWTPVRTWPLAYPADPAWPELAGVLSHQARAWGVLAIDGSEPEWTAALRRADEESALAALAPALPHDVDRIYLQNDLTAISPGPLAPALDVRLRGIARRESHAQASTYRFTDETISAALTEGEDAASILAFLAEISLTGVPQPLDYLVRSTAERHGTLRVRRDPEDPQRTRVESPTAHALRTIAVDQALRPLGLIPVEGGDALLSRVGRDAVLWSLVDARYPAVAVDDAGEVEPLRRHRIAAPPPTAAQAPEAYRDLIQTLRLTSADDADAAWLGRELESAVRSRSVVEVVVELPGGQTRTFVLEASGLGGGRLRGRERGADVERTLPLSSIRSARLL